MNRYKIDVQYITLITQDTRERLLATPNANTNLILAVLESIDLAHEMASNFSASYPQEDLEGNQKVVALTLLVRLIDIFESIVILSAHGVGQELHSLFRVFLDAYFLAENVCADASFVATYINTDVVNRRRLINAARQSPHEFFRELNAYATDDIREGLKQKIDEQKLQGLRSEEYAKRAGCEHIYNSMYRTTSAAVHTSPRCLNEYFEVGQLGDVKKIKHPKNVAAMQSILSGSASFLLKILLGLSEVYGKEVDGRVVQLDEYIGGEECCFELDR